MRIDINLNGNLLDFVDEEAIEKEIVYEAKSQIKEQIRLCVADSKEKIQDKIVAKVVEDILKQSEFSELLTSMLKKKIIDGIAERYKDNWNLMYDLRTSDIIQRLYNEHKEQYDEMLLAVLEQSIQEYKISDSIFSDKIIEMLNTNETYKKELDEFLSTRLYDLFDKI